MRRKMTILLRLTLGWFMFFAGIEKVLNPDWTAQGFLSAAKTFPDFYAWLALPQNLLWVDPLNAWGITLIGLGLFFGLGIRLAGIGGALLMILYYFPYVAFPTVPHGFIVEEHIIYAVAFLLIAFAPEARALSLQSCIKDSWLEKAPWMTKLL